jgi:hypothetical protein
VGIVAQKMHQIDSETSTVEKEKAPKDGIKENCCTFFTFHSRLFILTAIFFTALL